MEAITKGTGEGIGRLWENWDTELSVPWPLDVRSTGWNVTESEPASGYLAAVVIAGSPDWLTYTKGPEPNSFEQTV